MHIYCQWATDPPEEWVMYNSAEDLNSIQAKHLPHPDHAQGNPIEIIDTTSGWIQALCIQGVTFSDFDHYTAKSIDGAYRILCWNDDPMDWGDSRMAIQIDFYPISLDSKGIMNTKQIRTHWSTLDQWNLWTRNGVVQFDFDWFDWSIFVPPTENVFHGIWCDSAIDTELRRLQSKHPWMEWNL